MVQYNHKSFYQREVGRLQSENMTMEQRLEMMQLQAKEYWWPLEPGKVNVFGKNIALLAP